MIVAIISQCIQLIGLLWWLSHKESACNAGAAGATGSIPGSGRSPGEGNGNPLQYSCLENPMDRGAWRATVRHGVAKTDMTERLHTQHTIYLIMPLVATWMDLEIIILSEVSQTEKDKYQMITYVQSKN